MIEAQLFEWQTPEQMTVSVEALGSELRDRSLKREGRNFREAFVAAKFASAQNANAVRLLHTRDSQATPDFAVRLERDELWFETTEADRPGRKRGAEEHDQQNPIVHFDTGDWVDLATYRKVVMERVQAKVRKPYDKCDGLIIWSNAFPIKDEDALTLSWWNRAAADGIEHFNEVWVHHHRRFVRLG